MRVPKKYLVYSLFLIFFSFFFVNNSYAIKSSCTLTNISSGDLRNYGCDLTGFTQPYYISYHVKFNASLPSGSTWNYFMIQDSNSSPVNNVRLYSIKMSGLQKNFSEYSGIASVPEFNYGTVDPSQIGNAFSQPLYYFQITNPTYVDYVDLIFSDSLTDFVDNLPTAPSGSITLSSNGTYDVTSYAEAVVDVPATVIQGDYHDDLVRIYKAIMTCGAVVLVLYFFYCIYRMIIKSTGGKQ